LKKTKDDLSLNYKTESTTISPHFIKIKKNTEKINAKISQVYTKVQFFLPPLRNKSSQIDMSNF